MLFRSGELDIDDTTLIAYEDCNLLLPAAELASEMCIRDRALYYLCVYGTRDKRDPAGDPSAAQTLLVLNGERV